MMRNSNLSSSSINNQSDTQEDQEESGWTSYFDDFFSNKTPHQSSASKHMNGMLMAYDDGDQGNYSYSCGGSGSAVSDAASCVARNKSQYKNCDGTRADDVLAACSNSFDGTQMVVHKKLRFKKTINRHKGRSSDYYYYDDSLEDTASSPVNSPKAKGEAVYGGYDDQQASGGENGLKQQVVEVNKTLKEKGLCLVPYSMLVKYYIGT